MKGHFKGPLRIDLCMFVHMCTSKHMLSMHARAYTSPCIPENRYVNGDYVISFLLIERINILHSIGGNVILIRRKLQPGNINCYWLQPESERRKSNPVFPEITVPLNYSSYITVSAYIRTCFCKNFPVPFFVSLPVQNHTCALII